MSYQPDLFISNVGNSYQPDLFISNVGNSSANQIINFIEELGFGIVKKIVFQGISAIVVMEYWDVLNTKATRIILEEGKFLLLHYSDSRIWKTFAYKNIDYERDIEEYYKVLLIEEEKREKREIEEKAEQKDSKETRTFDVDNSSIKSVILDYGNISETYPIIRNKYKNIFNKLLRLT